MNSAGLKYSPMLYLVVL